MTSHDVLFGRLREKAFFEYEGELYLKIDDRILSDGKKRRFVNAIHYLTQDPKYFSDSKSVKRVSMDEVRRRFP
ncbi:hypothetical protein HQ571_01535 [Candidatus Kuenenbacteria bacterium]|nr:hypothetical protein [Candidatus Kuenenbacteria bacterium]